MQLMVICPPPEFCIRVWTAHSFAVHYTALDHYLTSHLQPLVHWLLDNTFIYQKRKLVDCYPMTSLTFHILPTTGILTF